MTVFLKKTYNIFNMFYFIITLLIFNFKRYSTKLEILTRADTLYRAQEKSADSDSVIIPNKVINHSTLYNIITRSLSAKFSQALLCTSLCVCFASCDIK